MQVINKKLPPPLFVIESLLKQNHTISIYSGALPDALPAEMIELNLMEGILILDINYAGSEVDENVFNGNLNIDIEIIKGVPPSEREGYSISSIPTILLETDANLCRVECLLPESFFAYDKRGAVRIPFILGMNCRARLEVFTHYLNISGIVKNLSVGGCLLELQLIDSAALDINQRIPKIYLEFPNGDIFISEGIVRHIRLFGNHGYIATGIEFTNLSPKQSEMLFHTVTESEREIAYLSGMSGHEVTKSPLFIPGSSEKILRLKEIQEREKRAQQSPMEKGIMEIAHQLQIGLITIKTKKNFPAKQFYDCADALLFLLSNDRKAFLYSLSFIRDEPTWVRHSINVASRFADIILSHSPHFPELREYVLGILLHNMGKPLLISEKLPSLDINLTNEQRTLLKKHVKVILDKFDELNWQPDSVCRGVIENANEKLDGSGYPSGKNYTQISPVMKLISVLKIIDKLSYRRNDLKSYTPLEVYRIVNQQQAEYERKWLVYYMKLYGTYPIGSLVKYSGGFLGWVTDIDSSGLPVTVRVVKDLRYPDANINSIISGSDLVQIGRLENVVDPVEYEIRVKKL
ncbi:HD domain-containing phosphohydrolase [Leclercia pneumoniae]|uniref:HD domain-containing phosphohydrolase n=1 Tax=Leclercia pneumoniae TaxID=2815358 RepID=UPI001A939E21|nr:HD domain-containing phosphohydrolase [Leclercia pneumoniae]QSW34631.1 PilZ domain-containing protein [Leclercia pneumoniae]